jgi:hypothetical protein
VWSNGKAHMLAMASSHFSTAALAKFGVSCMSSAKMVPLLLDYWHWVMACGQCYQWSITLLPRFHAIALSPLSLYLGTQENKRDSTWRNDINIGLTERRDREHNNSSEEDRRSR